MYVNGVGAFGVDLFGLGGVLVVALVYVNGVGGFGVDLFGLGCHRRCFGVCEWG